MRRMPSPACRSLRPSLFVRSLGAALLALTARGSNLAAAQSMPGPAHQSAHVTAAATHGCMRIQIEGKAERGMEWHASIGNGWLIRLVPVPSSHSSGSGLPKAMHLVTGWDLAVSPAGDQDYPDALLLASPPYASLNPREIATTFGLRAQDAIAWTPRHFHFLTTAQQLSGARPLYRVLMHSSARSAASPNVAGTHAAQDTHAAQALLRLISESGTLGSGDFAVLDARLIPGSADPPAFAREWAAALPGVPHTFLSDSGDPTPQGQLQSIQFHLELTLPPSWQLPETLHPVSVKCAE